MGLLCEVFKAPALLVIVRVSIRKLHKCIFLHEFAKNTDFFLSVFSFKTESFPLI